MITTKTFVLLTVLLVLFSAEAYAFGAGDIPDFAYLNGRAFRHGDIENILGEVAKAVGHAGGASSILGFAQAMFKEATGGSSFEKNDIKKVYFGNWLRDYSQAMDISGLTKLTADTLVLVVSILGFMEFGFATEEFEVTAERLGVYLPVEHIDNPKGYAEKEGDARRFHPRLRPPVDRRELEIDPRNGMKCYMATENRGWDTSTAHIRRVLRACIDYGRRAQGREGPDLWEAYRLLGTGLHTLEDLLAHSNWCELTLRKMGHAEVFCHVGEAVMVDTPHGRAPPLVTGTFGGADFLHSLMGEATDKLSQNSVSDLSGKIQEASHSNKNNFDTLKAILGKFSLGDNNNNMQQAQNMQAQSQAYHFDPNNIAPPEVQKQLSDLLKWRDSTYRQVLKAIDMIPGLSELLENFTDALNAYVYTLIAPYVTPILQQVTGVLNEGSKTIIDSADQYEVFDKPHASDPTHSVLSKDHFGLILNEPAGKVAQVVVKHAVNLIVSAWSDQGRNPDQVINEILEAFHHPYYNTGQSRVQQEMFREMEAWFRGLGSDTTQTLQALTKESVRQGKNKRHGSDESHGTGCGHGASPAYGRPAQSGGQAQYGSTPPNPSYGGTQSHGTRRDENTYGGETGSYGGGRPNEERYGASQSYNSGNQRTGGHDTGESRAGGRRREDTHGTSPQNRSYDDHRGEESYGGGGDYGSGRRHESHSGDTHRGGRHEDNTHQSGRYSREDRNQDTAYGGSQGVNQSYGAADSYNTGSRAEVTYGQTQSSYGAGRRPENTYAADPYGGRQSGGNTYGGGNQGISDYPGRQRRHDEGGAPGRVEEQSSRRGGGYGREEERTSYSNRGESEPYSGQTYGGGYQPSYDGDTSGGSRRPSERDRSTGNTSGGYTDNNEGYGRQDTYGSSRGVQEYSARDDYSTASSGRDQGYQPSYEQERGSYTGRSEQEGYGQLAGRGSRNKSEGYGQTYGMENLNVEDKGEGGYY